MAAIVASYDAQYSKYATEVCYQTGRVEYVLGTENAMVALYQNYMKANKGALPQQLLVRATDMSIICVLRISRTAGVYRVLSDYARRCW